MSFYCQKCNRNVRWQFRGNIKQCPSCQAEITLNRESDWNLPLISLVIWVAVPLVASFLLTFDSIDSHFWRAVLCCLITGVFIFAFRQSIKHYLEFADQAYGTNDPDRYLKSFFLNLGMYMMMAVIAISGTVVTVICAALVGGTVIFVLRKAGLF